MSYMREAVDRGMEFLDREHPGWELKIDLAKLDLNDACLCILGQVEGDFYYACEERGKDMGWAADYGFIPDSDVVMWAVTDDIYEKLTEAWRTALKERLDAGVTV